ncbi:MAG: hypothetical protein ACREVL_09270 [Solimonas sp.]
MEPHSLRELAQAAAIPMSVFYAGFVVFYFWKVHALFVHLRTHEPETFRQIGEPSLFWNNSPANNFKLFAFLYSKRYQSLSTAEGVAKARLVKNLLTSGLVFFAVMTFLVFYGFGTF